MSLLLKSTFVYIFTSTVIFAVYGWWVFGVLGIDYFTGPDAMVRIGQAISILIVGGYAFEWLVLAVFGLFSLRVLKHTKDDFTIDERDKKIVHQSLFNSHHVLCTGLFLSIGASAFGWGAFWVFHSIVLAFLLLVVTELATKLFLYNRAS